MKIRLLVLTFLTSLSLNLTAQSWDEVIKIVASDRAASDSFSYSVSISGDKAIIGAFGEDENAAGGNTLSGAGSAYVFELQSGVWTQTAKLVASDREAGDSFGFSVSISGDKALIGAWRKDEYAAGGNTISNSGAAYVFELQSGVWTETAQLFASDNAVDDRFGFSVSISGDKALIGAFQEDEDAAGSNTLSGAGSAYVFELQSGVWTQTTKLVASNRAASDSFGFSVSISGDKALIGAFGEDENAAGSNTLSGAGSAYVFELQSGLWTETAKFVASDRAASDYFGFSVSISGDKALIGAYEEDEDALAGNTLSGAGAAYVFELQSGVWTETAKLVASDRAAGDNFSISVSISGDKALIGASQEGEDAAGGNTLSGAGAAYMFELQSGVWTETAKLVASDRAENDRFGFNVGISDNKALIGAYQEDEDATGFITRSGAGSAYIFECTGCPSIGVKENNLTNLTIYPNPTQKEVTLSLTEMVKVELKDINGKILFTDKNATGNYTMDLSTYTKGLYFVKVSNQNGSASYKLIKE